MDISNYNIEIKNHAVIRAIQRGITPDIVEATIKGGKLQKFGNNKIKFIKKYKKFIVICIGEIVCGKIKIITIETKNEKRKKMFRLWN
ncbi:hypothetical protein HOK51_09245 [Candidatus Woesearchaeota archaeon]|jgi:hypothetical protein|nr:hypothetical protein [Candidatus Woesearchaeota archaeon]MBT6520015.1 hypothetical protein [Candidatus Woesearchaeota archaeon]MBT7367738.1 hypothetical protein [Candidatus Woesearchaeota archaeon]